MGDAWRTGPVDGGMEGNVRDLVLEDSPAKNGGILFNFVGFKIKVPRKTMS